MKTHIIATLIALIALNSCSSPALEQGQLFAKVSQNEMAFERQAFNLVNNYRKQNGLPTLKYHAGLSRLCRGHSDFMAKNDKKFKLEGRRVSHYGFHSRSSYAQLKYGVAAIGENVAAGWGKGSEGVTGALKGWKNSKAHNKAMLGKHWDISGVGVRVGPTGDIWLTQLFAVKQQTRPKGIGPEITF